jgi:hypothetical protein
MKVTIDTSGLMRIEARLASMDKQSRYAMARSLNAAAYKASRDVAKEIGRVFDKPTPWVLGSVRYVKATKDRLQAKVDFDSWGNKQSVTVAHVLRSQIFGGRRKLKRHEVALQRAGVLPPGHAIVPGSAARRDQYGNMSSGQIVQIMSWFKSFGEQGYSANMLDKGRTRLGRDNKRTGKRGFAYFMLRKKHGKLLPGIYQRFDFGDMGSAVKPVMLFIPIPAYRRALDFYGVAKRSAIAEFKAQFPKMMQEAMRTAR